MKCFLLISYYILGEVSSFLSFLTLNDLVLTLCFEVSGLQFCFCEHISLHGFTVPGVIISFSGLFFL